MYHHPLKKYNFIVVIDGIQQASFSEVSAPTKELELIEYREKSPRKVPSDMRKYGNVILKSGISTSKEFCDWIKKTESGDIVRKKVIIRLLNTTNTEAIAYWELENAWSYKWTGTDFDSSQNEMFFESIEFCHDGLTRLI